MEPRLKLPVEIGGQTFSTPLTEIGVGELGEDMVAVCECGKGHRFRVLHPPIKHFELLGHAAVEAYISGFYGEAVLDFMGAIERAYEYFCQVIHHSRRMSFELFDEAWKALGKLSERRLGWFAAVWLSETGKVHSVPDKHVKFRNDVVHNGVLPSKEQVEAFGEWAVTVIFDICEWLKHRHKESMTQHHFYYGKRRHARILAKVEKDPKLAALPDAGGQTSSVFGLNCGEGYPRRNFSEIVEELRKPNLWWPNPKVATIRGRSIPFEPWTTC